MPDMFEIYQSYAPQYHELVLAEDFQNNLGALLYSLVDWHGLSVLEVGVGTGRVTQLYIADVAAAVCCDQSQHMIDFAHRSLTNHSSKLTFQQVENTQLPDFDLTFDLFIEGWSFGHSIMACTNESEILDVANRLLSNIRKHVLPGSPLIIIETMGTNTEDAHPPHDKLACFYKSLTDRHGFQPHFIRTDYRFETNHKAADIMGFFFGEDMKQSVLARGTTTIPEWTGVWVKRT